MIICDENRGGVMVIGQFIQPITKRPHETTETSSRKCGRCWKEEENGQPKKNMIKEYSVVST